MELWEIVALEILGVCLAFMALSLLHAKYCDYCERRDVERSWVLCLRVTQQNWSASLHSSASNPAIVRAAKQEFKRHNLRRKEDGRAYLPQHLLGVPASHILQREGVPA